MLRFFLIITLLGLFFADAPTVKANFEYNPQPKQLEIIVLDPTPLPTPSEKQETPQIQPKVSKTIQTTSKPKIEPVTSNLVAKATSLKGKYGGQCVVFARSFAGASRSQIQGYARNTKINSQTPKVGAILVTNESLIGHVAVVIEDLGTHIKIVESNYNGSQRISIRTIPKNAKFIRGYLWIN